MKYKQMIFVILAAILVQIACGRTAIENTPNLNSPASLSELPYADEL